MKCHVNLRQISDLFAAPEQAVATQSSWFGGQVGEGDTSVASRPASAGRPSGLRVWTEE